MVGSWRLVAAGSWRRLVVGDSWWLMGVGGWRSLGAVLSKKKSGSLRTALVMVGGILLKGAVPLGHFPATVDSGTPPRPNHHAQMCSYIIYIYTGGHMRASDEVTKDPLVNEVRLCIFGGGVVVWQSIPLGPYPTPLWISLLRLFSLPASSVIVKTASAMLAAPGADSN